MSDPELTPDQEAQVRRLLADARHDEPVPADVAARLDAALADLSPETSHPVAPVTDLAARRRRRNAGLLLTAAAAVIVGGFGIGQVIDVGDADDDSADSSSVAARQQDDQAGAGDAASAQPGGGTSELAPEVRSVAPLELRSASLAADLEAQLPARVASDAQAAPESGGTFLRTDCAPAAPAAAYGVGDLFPAYYDGTPAVLALRPPADGTRRADVLACGTAAALASVTLPAR